MDSSIDEVEEVTEEKTVTVQEIPNRVSTVQFSQQNRGASQNLNWVYITISIEVLYQHQKER